MSSSVHSCCKFSGLRRLQKSFIQHFRLEDLSEDRKWHDLSYRKSAPFHLYFSQHSNVYQSRSAVEFPSQSFYDVISFETSHALALNKSSKFHVSCRHCDDIVFVSHWFTFVQDGWTPLCRAALVGYDAIVNLLLEHQANPDTAGMVRD